MHPRFPTQFVPHRCRPIFPPFFIAAFVLAACQTPTSAPNHPPFHSATDVLADRRTDPGYRPVSLTLPVLRSTGKHWRVVGNDHPLAFFVGQPIVAEGRMVLDESGAYRTQFRLVRDHIGCVDPTHQDEIEGAIYVRLPPDHSVQVTDALLRVEGTLQVEELRGNSPQLILDATAVQPLPKAGDWLLPMRY